MERLELRRVRAENREDIEVISRLAADPVIAAGLHGLDSDPGYLTAMVEALDDTEGGSFERGMLGFWLATDAQTGTAVLVINKWGLKSGEGEISYATSTQDTGRGYATEAVGRVLLELGETFPGISVTARIDEANRRSMRVLEKLGFEHLGTLPTIRALESIDMPHFRRVLSGNDQDIRDAVSLAAGASGSPRP